MGVSGWGSDWGTDWAGGWDVPGGGVRRLQGTIQNLRPKFLRGGLLLGLWRAALPGPEEVCTPDDPREECRVVEVQAKDVEVTEKAAVEHALDEDDAFDAELDDATKPMS